MVKRIVGALLLLLCAVNAGAQIPRTNKALYRDYQFREYFRTATWPRQVTVCTGGTGDYSTIAAALAAVAAKDSTERNWVARWTVLICAGAGGEDPETFFTSWAQAPIVVPPYTELSGMTSGHNNPVSRMGGVPTLHFTATSGTMVKLGGGSSLSNLQILWTGTPTAAVKVVEHAVVDDADDVADLAQLTNVAVQITAQGNGFAVDGLTEAVGAGGMYVYGGGILSDGNALGRAVVNNNATSGLGISLYGGRYAGSSGCTDLFRNAANSGVIKLFEGVRVDAGCTNDLTKVGTGAIEVYGGVNYGPASGTITNGILHAPYGTSNPAACSPGAVFVNTTGSAEKVCFCTATNTWKCAAGS